MIKAKFKHIICNVCVAGNVRNPALQVMSGVSDIAYDTVITMLAMRIKVMTVMIVKISELQLPVKLHNSNTLIPYLKNKAIAINQS
jgi:hypothetical protein